MRNPFDKFYYHNAIPPAARVDDGNATTVPLDTVQAAGQLGHVRYIVALGATDIAMGALKAVECDTVGGQYTDIPGCTYTALPDADADDDLYAIDIPMDGTRKRFLDIVATAGDGTAGTFLSAIAIGARIDSAPASAAQQGLAGLLYSSPAPES